ncbi:hypothetical protein M427DRAFT_219581 [Gonapodya prolifera JEL478]|uniref:CCHC-type domain-containing protein n=1 Tax=Gonapodya prolifera (strain JEL478) TaxID=1344416 RepID=A0A138ZYQ6_GONPJ|nr:hypothetical protein M427DRAFT_219581 [Gonapodya prolifera JEL478]|eukprot:KXS09642.1 hypothetical protein M427DRAFT_219581 [Gonapodya prolifera JEL478]
MPSSHLAHSITIPEMLLHMSNPRKKQLWHMRMTTLRRHLNVPLPPLMLFVPRRKPRSRLPRSVFPHAPNPLPNHRTSNSLRHLVQRLSPNSNKTLCPRRRLPLKPLLLLLLLLQVVRKQHRNLPRLWPRPRTQIGGPSPRSNRTQKRKRRTSRPTARRGGMVQVPGVDVAVVEQGVVRGDKTDVEELAVETEEHAETRESNPVVSVDNQSSSRGFKPSLCFIQVPPPAASRDVRPTEARARPGQRSSSEPPAARSTPVREASVEANYRHVAPAASPDHLPEDNCGKDFEDTADSAHNGPPRATVCYMCGRSGHQVSWCYETERLCSEGVVYLDKSRGKPVVRFYDGTGVVFGRDMFEKGLCMLDVIEGNAGEGRQRQQEQQNGDSGFGGGGGDARRGKGGVRGRGNGYVDRGRGSWRLRGGRRENREAGSDGQHYGNGNGNGPSRQNGYVE